LRIIDRRLGQMLTEDGPAFANWDQDATAIEDRYAEQDRLQVAGEIDCAPARFADHFYSVGGEKWGRVGQ
jgi:hypothetical protein